MRRAAETAETVSKYLYVCDEGRSQLYIVYRHSAAACIKNHAPVAFRVA